MSLMDWKFFLKKVEDNIFMPVGPKIFKKQQKSQNILMSPKNCTTFKKT